MDSSLNWYCLHTKPAKEKLVDLQLTAELGIETYFPKLKREKTVRQKRGIYIEPLFPRYLFCRLDLSTQFRAVRYSKNIIDIVRAGDKPAIVSESTILQLKDWAGEGLDCIEIQPDLKIGDEVEIIDGSMRGLHAIFAGDVGKDDRVSILSLIHI